MEFNRGRDLDSLEIKPSNESVELETLIEQVRADEVDVAQISVKDLIEKYSLELESQPLEAKANFVRMAATLLELKSRKLLPAQPEPAQDVEELTDEQMKAILEQHLEEYRQFKDVSKEFKEWEERMRQLFTRTPEEEQPAILEEQGPGPGVSLFDLLSALKVVLSKASPEETTLPREEIKITDKIQHILTMLSKSRTPEGISFFSLFHAGAAKIELIATFLALLELIRLKQIRAFQSEVFGDIRICLMQ